MFGASRNSFCSSLAILCCALLSTQTFAQSGSRQPAAMATRGNAKIQSALGPVAEPKPQNANPFFPSINRDLRLPLALSGFCAVTLREQQEWLLGAEQNQLIFDGQIYWFTSQRERAMFAASPLRYVPALGGDCVVTYAELGSRMRGNPKYGILHDQRLFFFRSQAEQETFRASPEEYADADLANDGQCLVSELDEQKQLPGLPETTAMVGGLRYQFAGVDQQKKFLINMRRYGVERKEIVVSDGSPRSMRGAPPALLTPAELAKGDSKDSSNGAKAVTESTVPVSEVNLVMGGYCPVSIHDSGVWILGDRKFRVEFDGQTYLFAGDAERRVFLRDPHAFIPALGGHCVVTEIDNNRRVQGNIYHAAHYDGRLFLFAGAEEKLAFKASPVSYKDADLVEGGNCVVTLVDNGDKIAGLEELLIWHQGKRYLFASKETQAKFREGIQRYQDR